MARPAHSTTSPSVREKSRLRQILSFERIFFTIGVLGLIFAALFVVKSYV